MSLSRGHRTEHAPKVEINIVPLVDVSLVLLIIFMVTATFMKTAGMRIQLPTSSAARDTSSMKKEIIIGVDSQGKFLWGGQYASDNGLSDQLVRSAQMLGTETRVTIQGDERAAHGRVVKAMSLAQGAGFSHLVISTRKDFGRDGQAR